MKRLSREAFLRCVDSGRFHASLWIADGLAAGGLACIYSGFAGVGTPQWELALRFAALLSALHMLCLSYSPAWRPARPPAWAWLAAVNGLASFLLAQTPLGSPFSSLRLAWLMPVVFFPLQAGLHLVRARSRLPLEPLRWAMILAGAIAVTYPLLTNVEVGSGDAYWYASMTADFVAQWRAGIFPVFVGQSIYAFNGAVSPLRLAPYLQHAAGVLDFLTAHSLSVPGLLNLTLFASLLGGAVATYGALLAIEGRARWIVLLMALFYLAAPAPLALLYSGNLFMSVCTLPYLPLVMLGTYRSYTEIGVRGVSLLAVALAAVWTCHPPIAIWCTLAAFLGQCPRLFSKVALEPQAIRGWLAAASLFGVLTVFTFGSNFLLSPVPGAVARSLIIKGLSESFVTTLLPVSDYVAAITDHQLGWTLWGLLVFGLVGTAILRQKWLIGLALGALAILAFVIPVPWLFEAVWHALPQTIVNISYYWPIQRFYVLLSSLAVFLGYGVCIRFALRRPWVHALVVTALLLPLYWTGIEAGFFVRGGILRTTHSGTPRAAHAPANQILTRYAINPFPAAPPYFSHSYIDPLWENRLLASDATMEIGSNYAAAVGPAALVQTEGDITPQDLGSGYYMLLDHLSLLPKRHYALEFTFAHPELTGTFVGESRNLIRTYEMPDSGSGVGIVAKPTGFGSLPTSKKAISLVNDTAQEDQFRLQFVANAPVTADIRVYGHYALKEYDPVSLPVVIETWTPYRAQVAAPAGSAWLETPRMFLDGYRAKVNGRKVSVARSPGGLVMIPIQPGDSRVELEYPGTLLLRAYYFCSLLGWIGVGGFVAFRIVRRLWRSSAPEPGEPSSSVRTIGAETLVDPLKPDASA